jgi:PadR family transcriptional regulator PadR
MSKEGHIVYPYNKNTQGANKKMINNIQKEVQVKLTKGLLDVIVLQLLKNEPMHGYQIITSIRRSFGVYFGPSTVYPLLNGLEKKGYLLSEWNMETERPRKIYSLTNSGQNLLAFTEGSLNLIVRNMPNTTAQPATLTMQASIAPNRVGKIAKTPALVH